MNCAGSVVQFGGAGSALGVHVGVGVLSALQAGAGEAAEFQVGEGVLSSFQSAVGTLMGNQLTKSRAKCAS